jgi:hypothetical protein
LGEELTDLHSNRPERGGGFLARLNTGGVQDISHSSPRVKDESLGHFDERNGGIGCDHFGKEEEQEY